MQEETTNLDPLQNQKKPLTYGEEVAKEVGTMRPLDPLQEKPRKRMSDE